MENNILKLKNGDCVKLEWNFLILEYLEEYPGGLRALNAQIKSHKNEIKICNHLCYAVLNANYKTLTYIEAVKLIDLKGLRTIQRFIEKNESEFNEYKKKDQPYTKKKKNPKN